MEHTWQELPPLSNGSQYLQMDGLEHALVRITPDPNGEYLWQFGRKSGTVATVEEAKAAVEAFEEYRHIPADQRWLSL